MTERPFVGGVDTAVGPTPGYYPDPSVPGFVRYWGGAAWVPGTSRPAPSDGEVLEPPRFAARQSAPIAARYVPPPAAAPAAVPAAVPVSAAETGPVYLDQTSAGASFTRVSYTEPGLRVSPALEAAPEPVPPALEPPELSELSELPEPPDSPYRAPTGWRADPGAQRGLLEAEDAPRWVSWGALPAEPQPEPVPVAPVAPAPAVLPVPAPAALPAPAPAPLPAPEPVSRPVVPAAAALPTVRSAQARLAGTPRRVAPRPAAGLGRRLVARLVDSLVAAVVAVGVGVPLVSSAVDHLQQKLDQARVASELTGRDVQVWMVDPVVLGKAGVLLGVLVLLGLVYEVVPTARTGQTFGKRLARIRVVDARVPGRGAEPLSLGRSLLRWLVGQLGALLVVGLFWPLCDGGSRRGWQDRAAGSRVVRA